LQNYPEGLEARKVPEVLQVYRVRTAEMERTVEMGRMP
jgi:hypothetical protein